MRLFEVDEVGGEIVCQTVFRKQLLNRCAGRPSLRSYVCVYSRCVLKFV